MRSFLIPAAALAALSASPASAATRNLGVTSFEKVRIEGPYKITIRTGVAPFARAIGNQAALDRINVEMRDNTLIIRNDRSPSATYTGRDAGTVEIELGTHDLSSAWLNGSGTMAIDRVRGLSFDLSVQGSGGAEIGEARVDQLSVALFGTATARLSGQAARMTGIVRGVSTLDAGGLSAHDAMLTAEGSATIEAAVSNSAKVDADGPATVRLAGRPACTLRVSGSAEVSGCR